MCLKIADDTQLFTHIGAENTAPKSLTFLASATGVEAASLKRVLRHLAARHILLDFAADPDTYGATHISAALAARDASSGIRNGFRVYMPAFFEFPDVLRDTGYKAPTDGRNGLFQRRCGCPGLTMFQCMQLPENSHVGEDFDLLMKYTTKGRVSFLDVCSMSLLLEKRGPPPADEGAQGYVFVDIGGGLGTDVVEFRSRFPDVNGQVELQELGGVIAAARDAGVLDSGLLLREYDMFTAQPVHGARFYFMGSVLHDWPDQDAKRILSNVAAAMKKGYSTLLLSESVLPEAGCHPGLSAIDLTMATLLASKERSEHDWGVLVGSVGLRIVKVYTIPSSLKSVVECELA